MIDAIALTISIFGTVLVACVTFLKNKQSAANSLFALFNLSLSLWIISNHLSIHSNTESQTLFWIRMTMFFAICQSISFFLFCYTFPNPRLKLSRIRLIALTIVSLLVSVIVFTPWVFRSVTHDELGKLYAEAQIGILLFAFNCVGLVLFSFVTLFRRRRAAEGLLKLQLTYLLIGSLLMFTLILFFDFVLVNVFNNTAFINLGALFTLPFILVSTYAITRSRLLDVRIAVRKTILYAIIAISISVLFAGFSYLVLQIFGATVSATSYILGAIAASIFIGFLYGLRIRFKRYPNVLRNYDTLADELQSAVNTQLTRLSPARLQENIAIDLSRIIPIEHIVMYLWNFSDGVYLSSSANSPKIYQHNSLVLALYRKRSILFRDKVKEYVGEFETDFCQKLIKEIDRLEARIIVPIFAGDDLVSIVCIKSLNESVSFDILSEIDGIVSKYAIVIRQIVMYQQAILRAKKGVED